MADSTIANLSSGAPAVSTDQIPIQRGSSTLKLTVGDINSIQTLSVTITPTMLKAFDGTAPTDVVVIANPGAGKGILIENVWSNLQFATTPYATGTVGLALIWVGGARISIGTICANGLVVGSSSQLQQFCASSFAQGASTRQVNVPVVINLPSASSSYTAGDSPIQISIAYRVVSNLA